MGSCFSCLSNERRNRGEEHEAERRRAERSIGNEEPWIPPHNLEYSGRKQEQPGHISYKEYNIISPKLWSRRNSIKTAVQHTQTLRNPIFFTADAFRPSNRTSYGISELRTLDVSMPSPSNIMSQETPPNFGLACKRGLHDSLRTNSLQTSLALSCSLSRRCLRSRLTSDLPPSSQL